MTSVSTAPPSQNIKLDAQDTNSFRQPESRVAGKDEMYCLKTMCLATQHVELPSHEDHRLLLRAGLGARSWKIKGQSDPPAFKEAILKLYSRLRRVDGYQLWTPAKKEKAFERIPDEVNSPALLRLHLGSRLHNIIIIIVPTSDLTLMREGEATGTRIITNPPPTSRLSRKLCLICGRVEKIAGTGYFHNIFTVTDRLSPPTTIASRLDSILGLSIEFQKKSLLISDELCNRCLGTVIEFMQTEEKVREKKQELVSSLFNSTLQQPSKKSRQENSEASLAQRNGDRPTSVNESSGGSSNAFKSPSSCVHFTSSDLRMRSYEDSNTFPELMRTGRPVQSSTSETFRTGEEETQRRDPIRTVKPAAHKSSTLTLVQFQNLIDPNMLTVKSGRHEAKALCSADSPIAETDIEGDD